MLRNNHGKFTQAKCMHTNTLLCVKTHYCACVYHYCRIYLRKRKTSRQCFTHGMCKFAEIHKIHFTKALGEKTATNKTKFFQQE